MSLPGRFCCRSPLQAFLVGDSVAVMRFATGASDDGAAESLPGAFYSFRLEGLRNAETKTAVTTNNKSARAITETFSVNLRAPSTLNNRERLLRK
jgi:hypothetical protein